MGKKVKDSFQESDYLELDLFLLKFSAKFPICGAAKKEKDTQLTSNSLLASISGQVNSFNIFF